MPSPPISYQLVIHLRHGLQLTVGSLGSIRLPAGRYVYTGSAKRAFEARIARHLRKDKKRHWHIDHLLTSKAASIVEVRRCAREECALNRSTGGSIVAPGFGASDCRAGCGSHLKYQGSRVSARVG